MIAAEIKTIVAAAPAAAKLDNFKPIYKKLINGITDIEYNENFLEDNINIYLMKITQLLKSNKDIFIKKLDKNDYKNFSDELYKHVITDTNKNKSYCDLILFDILCRMNLYQFDGTICDDPKIIILTDLDKPDSHIDYSTNKDIEGKTRKEFLVDNKNAINKINSYINLFEIQMDKKIILYQILNILIFDKFIDITKGKGKEIAFLFSKLINTNEMGCAPRTIVEAYKTGGNKSGKYDYYLCKCNFKESLKKVVAKTAREAAKNLAKKVLKGNKKSIKFTLKRLIGKKEKYYNYEAHFDKNGKIVIKNQ
jgi:hypothetical protein